MSAHLPESREAETDRLLYAQFAADIERRVEAARRAGAAETVEVDLKGAMGLPEFSPRAEGIAIGAICAVVFLGCVKLLWQALAWVALQW